MRKLVVLLIRVRLMFLRKCLMLMKKLTDDELLNVSGGQGYSDFDFVEICEQFYTKTDCEAVVSCRWSKDGRCEENWTNGDEVIPIEEARGF